MLFDMKTCGTNMYELARECGVASMVDDEASKRMKLIGNFAIKAKFFD